MAIYLGKVRIALGIVYYVHTALLMLSPSNHTLFTPSNFEPPCIFFLDIFCGLFQGAWASSLLI